MRRRVLQFGKRSGLPGGLAHSRTRTRRRARPLARLMVLPGAWPRTDEQAPIAAAAAKRVRAEAASPRAALDPGDGVHGLPWELRCTASTSARCGSRASAPGPSELRGEIATIALRHRSSLTEDAPLRADEWTFSSSRCRTSSACGAVLRARYSSRASRTKPSKIPHELRADDAAVPTARVPLGQLGLERRLNRVATLCCEPLPAPPSLTSASPCGGFVLHHLNLRRHPNDLRYTRTTQPTGRDRRPLAPAACFSSSASARISSMFSCRGLVGDLLASRSAERLGQRRPRRD